MSEKTERSNWAWERIEALADDSLDVADRARMDDALRVDPRLRAAVERARAVRRSLRDLRRSRVPAGLLGRLLAAPFPRRRRSNWLLIGAPAAVAAIAIGVAFYVSRPAPQPNEAQLAAMRELVLAMRYLQRSAVITEEEVSGVVTAGLLDAFRAGHITISDEKSEDEDGG